MRRCGTALTLACPLALAFSALVALSRAPAALADPTPAQAAAELSAWRAAVGELPVAAATVPAWDTGCHHHDGYEHDNGGLTHFEWTYAPGYTIDGAAAGLNSVIAEESGPSGPLPDAQLLPGPVWDGSVFHRAALLNPRLAQVGFDSTTFAPSPGESLFQSYQCTWVGDFPVAPGAPSAIDNSRTTPSLTLYPSPANGASGVPTEYPAGTESPNPATETGVPLGSSLGWLLNVEINGPWADGGDGGIVFAHGVTATLGPDGTGRHIGVVVSQCGSRGCATSDAGGTADGPYFGGGFGIFPLQPLAADTTYRVVLTGGTVTDTSTDPPTQYPIPVGYSWCFSTGASYMPSADCPAAGPGAVSEAALAGTIPATASATTPVVAPLPRSEPPSATRAVLSGVAGRRPRLSVKLLAGSRPLKGIELILPGGLRFANRLRQLDAGLRVADAHGQPVGFTAGLRHGMLTITLTGTASAVQLDLSGHALRATAQLMTDARRRRPEGFSVWAIDAAGQTTQLRLSVTP